jgi:hypothetical protein
MGASMRDAMIGACASGVMALTVLALVGCQKAATAANPADAGGSNAASVASATPAAPATQAAPAGLDQASAAEAQAFLAGLYAHYKTSKGDTFDMFDAKSGVFDADTTKLLAEDARALKGDLGVIDGDWLCACQDFVSLQAKITILGATPTTAKAESEFVDVGMTDPKDRAPRHDRFDLVKEAGHWRIHDVQTAGADQSLRQMVEKEIADLKKHPNG